MSNERHLTIDDGTMGNVFRRVTLASLGLDSLEGVSEQSFEVVDRADAFAARLLGGVSHVMPKVDSDRLGTQSADFADHLCIGMSGLNGPKNATDLGDWQYWLDAALLMLFDEDEEEEESASQASSSARTNAARRNGVSASAVRSRVEALRSSGVTPAMLQTLPQSAKKKLVEDLKKSEISAIEITEKLSQTIKNASSKRGMTIGDDVMGRILAANSRQSIVSHIADKASQVSSALLSLDKGTSDKVASLTQRWTQSIQKIGAGVQGSNDMSAVREMLGTLDELEKLGAVTSEQAKALRAAGNTFARRVLMEEITSDASAVASRMESMINRVEMRNANTLTSQRAMSVSAGTTAEDFKRSFAALSDRLGDFSAAVSARVLTEGETAATVRWNRAADRFTRLQGVSDDIDRVLLRDIEESAAALSSAGIVPQSLLDSVIRAGARMSMQNAADSVSSSSSVNDVLAYFGASKVLGQLATKIEQSVESLVREVSKAGAAGQGIESFVTDIRQMLSTGNGGAFISGGSKASSVIESICARLDEFADMTAAGIVTNGYDELTETVATYVSTAEEKSASEVESVMSGRSNSVKAAQMVQNAIAQANREAQAQLKAFIEGQKATGHAELLNALAEAVTPEALVAAQKALEPHLGTAERAVLSQNVEAVRRSQAHLESVSKQIRMIENTIRVSNSLRSTNAARAAETVTIDGLRIDSGYLRALNSTLKSYAKIREDYRGMNQQAISGMTEARLERMLSTVKPENTERGNISTDREFAGITDSGVVLGYDEIIPDSMSWVKQNAHYPTTSEAGNVSAMLGSQKAVAMHAADVAGGRAESVKALAETLSKAALSGKDVSNISSYSVTNDGEQVKVSLTVKPSQAESSKRFELRQQIGNAYMPKNAVTADKAGMSAKLSVTKVGDTKTVSGIQEFVPVAAGANSSESRAVDSNSARELGLEILGRLGIQGTQNVGDKFRLNVGGVDFEMTSNDFVQMVAKPAMDLTANRMPSMLDANNALFAGYASMLSETGERRSLKALRHAYVESLARTAANSAHSEIGFSTQSFTHVMGLGAKANATVTRVSDQVKGSALNAAEMASEAVESGMNLADGISASKEREISSEFSGGSDLSWVSNKLSPNVKEYRQATEQSAENAHQLLGRIDSMLDYVENLSERNVGVFSSEDTVRVLLEALPQEGQLGNKGLPKWRQKDTLATRAAEARELREALAKIGATPVQGTQRYANKQYVSPNLLQDQGTGSSPLFSGGEGSATTPGAAANSSDKSSDQFSSSSIKDEDLQFIAEEVVHMIEESLNEEMQRGRSE